MTFDLIRVRYVVRSGLVMLMTKFGQNRLNNVGARADYMLLGMGGMDVDRRRKKKEERRRKKETFGRKIQQA